MILCLKITNILRKAMLVLLPALIILFFPIHNGLATETLTAEEVVDNLLQSYFDETGTVEGFVEFKQKWEPRLTEIESLLDPLDKQSKWYAAMRALIVADIALPKEENITVTEAIKLAEQFVARIPSWPEDGLTYFNRIADIYVYSPEVGMPIYRFLYERRSIMDKEYEYVDFETALQLSDGIESKMFIAFGGEVNAPWYVLISIDPISGELAKAIEILYPGNNPLITELLVK